MSLKSNEIKLRSYLMSFTLNKLAKIAAVLISTISIISCSEQAAEQETNKNEDTMEQQMNSEINFLEEKKKWITSKLNKKQKNLKA